MAAASVREQAEAGILDAAEQDRLTAAQRDDLIAHVHSLSDAALSTVAVREHAVRLYGEEGGRCTGRDVHGKPKGLAAAA